MPTASSFQGTLIMANIDSALFDPAYWETPHQFNPGHFLDKDGNFVTQEAFLAFSAGECSENQAQVCGLGEDVLFSLWRRPKGSATQNCRSHGFPSPDKFLTAEILWIFCEYSVAGCCAGADLFCINQYSSVQSDEWKIQKLDQIHPEVYVFPVELLELLTSV